MTRHIFGMTSRQTKRVYDVVVPLTRAWLIHQGAHVGRYGGAAAFANLDRDVYVGIVQFSYSTVEGQAVSGKLVWNLDYTFAPTGPPEVTLKAREEE